MKSLKPLLTVLAFSACMSVNAEPTLKELGQSIKAHPPAHSMDEDIQSSDTDESFANLKSRSDTDSALAYIQAKDLKKTRDLMFLNSRWIIDQSIDVKLMNNRLEKIEALLQQIALKN